jgi:hypothetical protein
MCVGRSLHPHNLMLFNRRTGREVGFTSKELEVLENE